MYFHVMLQYYNTITCPFFEQFYVIYSTFTFTVLFLFLSVI